MSMIMTKWWPKLGRIDPLAPLRPNFEIDGTVNRLYESIEHYGIKKGWPMPSSNEKNARQIIQNTVTKEISNSNWLEISKRIQTF